MNHIIIRTCVKDDYLAKLCYESFKLVKIDGNYIFLADDGNYKHIIDINKTEIIYKKETNNYGGHAGVVGLLHNGLNNLQFDDEDTVIISDSDIIVFDNFLKEVNVDHCGVGGKDSLTGLFHLSGQMQIFKGHIANRLKNLTSEEIHHVVHKEMVPSNINVADDTFNSYMTDKWACTKKLLPPNLWIHYKAYEFNNTDYLKAIEEIRKRFL